MSLLILVVDDELFLSAAGHWSVFALASDRAIDTQPTS